MVIAAAPPSVLAILRASSVGAAMAAEQGHGEGAVVGDRHHRRLGALVAEQGRQHADQDTRRADADDRPPRGVNSARSKEARSS